MRLTELTCHSFRSIRHLQMRPGTRINVIHGDNAQGKTSVLEALLYLATSKSHRTSADEELRQYGADGFHASCRAVRADRDVVLETTWRDGVKRFRVNGVAQDRISDVLGKLIVVLFSPEDIALVKGGAAGRRHFLDMELSQVQPRYLTALQKYRQALRQRNQLLKTQPADPALIDVWDEQLTACGTVVRDERAQFVSELGKLTMAAYRHIAGDEELTLAYVPDIKTGDALRDVLRRNRDMDLRRGQTSRGPHRDDFDFVIDGRPARAFASQGQQKSAALALKLAEMELVKQRTNEYPVLMLDDVFSELDRARSARVIASLPEDVQCLLTTTETARRSDLFGDRCSYFLIEGGDLREEEG